MKYYVHYTCNITKTNDLHRLTFFAPATPGPWSRYLFVLLLFLVTNAATQAQDKNFSYFKLCVTNAEDEILLVKYKGDWELAGKRYTDPRTLREFTGFMAEEMGVTFTDLRLRGLFTLYYNEATNPILFHYYSATYASGDLVVPPGCTDIAWFSVEEALEIIPFEVMTMILRKMYEQRGYVWGASIHIEKEPNEYATATTLREDFYPLSE